MHNRSDKGTMDLGKSHRNQHENDDFDPDIILDDLTKDSNKSPRRGNLQSVQLAAKMVTVQFYFNKSYSLLAIV